jgi:hypothetical protein
MSMQRFVDDNVDLGSGADLKLAVQEFHAAREAYENAWTQAGHEA